MKKYISVILFTIATLSCTYDKQDLIESVRNNNFDEISENIHKFDLSNDTELSKDLLRIAYDQDNFQIFLTLLQNDANPNVILDNGENLIKKAFYENKKTYYKSLIQSGANSFLFVKQGSLYEPMLNIFIMLKQEEDLIPYLLDDYDYSYYDGDGNSLLHISALYNVNSKVFENILTHFEDVNIKNNRGETPFLLACFESNIKNLMTLLSSGADVNTVSEYNYPWGIAIRNIEKSNNYHVADFLLQYGAPLDEIKSHVGAGPLFHACEIKNLEIAEYLLMNGASPYKKDENGFAPLAYLGGPFEYTEVEKSKFVELFNRYFDE